MSKFACQCGHVINLSQGWNDAELMLIPQKDVERLGEGVESGSVKSAEAAYDILDSAGKTVYDCPNCHRLHIEVGKNIFVTYIQEIDLRNNAS
jgi:hypothetical protein